MTVYTDKLEEELLDKCIDIPFENSLFQTEAFILNSSYTESRAVRAIGLQLATKIQALRELEFNMEKAAIEKEQIEAKIYTDMFEQRLANLEIRKREASMNYTKKLLKDCIYECEYLRSILAKLPKLSRAEFEAQEEQYFIASLTRQAIGMPEPIKALEAMGQKIEASYSFPEQPTLSKQLSAGSKEFLKLGDGNVVE